MAFPPKKPYTPSKTRPPGSPEPGDKVNNTRNFDARPKPIVEPGRYEPRRHAPDRTRPADDAAAPDVGTDSEAAAEAKPN
ncbi:MAG: hypothetical protein Q8R02_04410 [Hyphomonadaceae bacterium]|nr:hypothetical protein [Hyphomonadaceae bacterium]